MEREMTDKEFDEVVKRLFDWIEKLVKDLEKGK